MRVDLHKERHPVLFVDWGLLCFVKHFSPISASKIPQFWIGEFPSFSKAILT